MINNSPSETTDQSWEVTVTVHIVPDIVTVTDLVCTQGNMVTTI